MVYGVCMYVCMVRVCMVCMVYEGVRVVWLLDRIELLLRVLIRSVCVSVCRSEVRLRASTHTHAHAYNGDLKRTSERSAVPVCVCVYGSFCGSGKKSGHM